MSMSKEQLKQARELGKRLATQGKIEDYEPSPEDQERLVPSDAEQIEVVKKGD